MKYYHLISYKIYAVSDGINIDFVKHYYLAGDDALKEFFATKRNDFYKVTEIATREEWLYLKHCKNCPKVERCYDCGKGFCKKYKEDSEDDL